MKLLQLYKLIKFSLKKLGLKLGFFEEHLLLPALPFGLNEIQNIIEQLITKTSTGYSRIITKNQLKILYDVNSYEATLFEKMKQECQKGQTEQSEEYLIQRQMFCPIYRLHLSIIASLVDKYHVLDWGNSFKCFCF